MPMYVISYDLRKQRNYVPLWNLLKLWKATKLLESLWLAELRGPASEVRDYLRKTMDGDDGVAVIQLQPNFDWATFKVQPAGQRWLQLHSP